MRRRGGRRTAIHQFRKSKLNARVSRTTRRPFSLLPLFSFSLPRYSKADLKRAHLELDFPGRVQIASAKPTFAKVHGLRSLSRCAGRHSLPRSLSSLSRAIRKLYDESPGIDTNAKKKKYKDPDKHRRNTVSPVLFPSTQRRIKVLGGPGAKSILTPLFSYLSCSLGYLSFSLTSLDCSLLASLLKKRICICESALGFPRPR